MNIFWMPATRWDSTLWMNLPDGTGLMIQKQEQNLSRKCWKAIRIIPALLCGPMETKVVIIAIWMVFLIHWIYSNERFVIPGKTFGVWIHSIILTMIMAMAFIFT